MKPWRALFARLRARVLPGRTTKPAQLPQLYRKHEPPALGFRERWERAMSLRRRRRRR